MSKPARYAPEVRQGAVRMVFDHDHDRPSQGAAIQSVARPAVTVRRRRGALPSARTPPRRAGQEASASLKEARALVEQWRRHY